MQKAERLMAITLLLQARGKLTAEHLADILSVSVRTVYRDMNSLSLAHVPVTMDYGPGGGYFLPEEYRVGPGAFTGEEAAALALGATIAGGAGLFAGNEGIQHALIKLEAALPAEYRADVRTARDRILLDTDGWHRRPPAAPFLEPVRIALWQGRRLSLLFPNSEDCGSRWRQVDPLGLVYKSAEWYLVGYCYMRADFRTFRLSRIQDLDVQEENVVPRPDFDLKSFWEKSIAEFDSLRSSLPVTLRVSPDLLCWMEHTRTVLRRDPDGWGVVLVQMDSMDAAVGYVLSLGTGALVLDPPEVRDALAQAARSIVQVYEQENLTEAAGARHGAE